MQALCLLCTVPSMGRSQSFAATFVRSATILAPRPGREEGEDHDWQYLTVERICQPLHELAFFIYLEPPAARCLQGKCAPGAAAREEIWNHRTRGIVDEGPERELKRK